VFEKNSQFFEAFFGDGDNGGGGRFFDFKI
jgi:hypothetical protein